MKVHKHSSTSVINREVVELHTKRNLKLQLVNSTSSEPRPLPSWIRVITPCCGQCYWVAKERSGAWDRHRARGRTWFLPPNWKTWPQPVASRAGQDDGNMQKSPLMGSLREKEVLEVYYFHISWYVCEPLGHLWKMCPGGRGLVTKKCATGGGDYAK